MQAHTKRAGMGVIEILIICAVLIVIGGLAYVALVPKKDAVSTNVQTQASPNNTTYNSLEEVKSAQKDLDKEDAAEVQKDSDSLTADLNSL